MTVGIFLNAVIAVPFGDQVKGELAHELYFLLSALPVLFAVLQIVFLSFCFTNDTPIVMMQKNQVEEVRAFMSRMYNDDQVIEQRIQDLQAVLKESTSSGEKPSVG